MTSSLACCLTTARKRSCSDYVENLWRHAHGDRLYGTFRQVGTETGRMSSSNPNLQNIPKSDLRVRHMICAGEGKVLVGADQDNIELRTPARATRQAGRSSARSRTGSTCISRPRTHVAWTVMAASD